MTNFKVQWENTIEANSPLDAANQAYNDISQAQTLAFTVIDEQTQQEFSVDLSQDCFLKQNNQLPNDYVPYFID